MTWNRVFVEAGALLAAAVLLGALSNLGRGPERRLAWVGSYLPQAASDGAARTSEPGLSAPAAGAPAGGALGGVAPPKDPGLLYLEISGPVVERMHRAGALFIDARRSEEYRRGHIAGAGSMPIWESDVDARIAALQSDGTPIDRVIVTYCGGADCRDSKLLAEKLALVGFFNLYVYTGGMPEWQRGNGPVRTGDAP